jgi:hypothetical protein
MAFYRACWDVLKEDIMKVFVIPMLEIERSLNAMFISLILKILRVVDPKGFRLIGLLSSIYKIIAKILTNVLKTVFEKTISKSQNALIQGPRYCSYSQGMP